MIQFVNPIKKTAKDLNAFAGFTGLQELMVNNCTTLH